MKTLNQNTQPIQKHYPPRIIQFGEGNFMRAFTNWQIQQLNHHQKFNGSITVVQPLPQGLGHLFAAQDNRYTVLLEGLLDGQAIESHEIIDTLHQLINPYEEFQDFLSLADEDDYQFIFSNTTEAGIAFVESDRFDDQPPSSFPGKLVVLLHRRFTLGKAGFTIIPCELIDRNGDKLKEAVLKYAHHWNLDEAFIQWINEANTFCCSLVDRIVPGYPRDKAKQYEQTLGYQDQLMVVAEPFLLWVIEGPASLRDALPFHEIGLQVIVTDDMKPYRERKVHLLNGPHTTMVPLGLLKGLETVEEVMKDPQLFPFIQAVMDQEIIPTLDLDEAQLHQYAASIIERFNNPYIAHHLASIALNSISKYKTRLLPVVLSYYDRKGTWPKRLLLAFAAYLVMYNRTDLPVQDDEDIVSTIRKAWDTPNTLVQTILSQETWWGQDLNQYNGLKETIEHLLDALMTQPIEVVLSEEV